VDPLLDADLLSRFEGLAVYDGVTPPRAFAGNRFNLMIIGQDDQGDPKLADGRTRLASRADVIMVLSTDLATKKMTILSIYRDQAPTQACTERLGQSAPDAKINGVYSIGGRKMFIPCFEGMMEENLRAAGLADEYLDGDGHFRVNAFVEGTRSKTIRPVGKGALQVLQDNWFQFLLIYNINALGAALDVLTKGGAIQDSLSPDKPLEIKEGDVDFDYLSTELKERYAYKAGGFQRAFNFAYVIADIMGWAGYGIEHSGGYEFLGFYFGDIINQNFSRSIDFKAFEKEFLMAGGDHLFRHACYRGGYSPIKIIQWGEDKDSYATFENGEFRVSKKVTLLKFLKVVDILPTPPSC
jgi:hypothetical protein